MQSTQLLHGLQPRRCPLLFGCCKVSYRRCKPRRARRGFAQNTSLGVLCCAMEMAKRVRRTTVWRESATVRCHAFSIGPPVTHQESNVNATPPCRPTSICILTQRSDGSASTSRRRQSSIGRSMVASVCPRWLLHCSCLFCSVCRKGFVKK